MKKQLNPTIKAHLIRSAFYILLLVAICLIPFALAQRNTTSGAAQLQPKPAFQTINTYTGVPVGLGPVTVTATGGNTGPTSYLTLQLAFAAINIGVHQGVINVAIVGDTTETVSAVLNATGGTANYTSVSVQPSGGVARTISGAILAGSPLIDLNGATNVTIDGIGTGGNALTISNTTASATAGTSTIRFINGASSDTVTRCTILGSSTAAVGTAGGNVLFSTSTVAGGNSNNVISNNNIGPAGANLPTIAVVAPGSASLMTIPGT